MKYISDIYSDILYFYIMKIPLKIVILISDNAEWTDWFENQVKKKPSISFKIGMYYNAFHSEWFFHQKYSSTL